MKTNSNKIFFTFQGVSVQVESDWREILDLLNKDFYAFICDEQKIRNIADFCLKIVKGEAPDDLIPEIQSVAQSQSSLSYDVFEERFNDYYGELTSHIDFKKNRAVLYSLSLDKMHEVAYLIILSRVGKKLDLMGFHKLHAAAVSFKGTAVICMMPSKGGKSTLLMELLKDPRIKMISDDIPLIDRFGTVWTFPLKIGLSDIAPGLEVENPGANIYEMKRSLHGVKKLISVAGIKNKVEPVETSFNRIVLIEAFRVNSAHSYLVDAAWVRTFKGLIKHGVIGFGLPMVMEYFWENGWRDFLTKAFIFLSRLESFFILSLRAKRLQLRLGKKPEKAAKEILNYLEKNM